MMKKEKSGKNTPLRKYIQKSKTEAKIETKLDQGKKMVEMKQHKQMFVLESNKENLGRRDFLFDMKTNLPERNLDVSPVRLENFDFTFDDKKKLLESRENRNSKFINVKNISITASGSKNIDQKKDKAENIVNGLTRLNTAGPISSNKQNPTNDNKQVVVKKLSDKGNKIVEKVLKTVAAERSKTPIRPSFAKRDITPNLANERVKTDSNVAKVNKTAQRIDVRLPKSNFSKEVLSKYKSKEKTKPVSDRLLKRLTEAPISNTQRTESSIPAKINVRQNSEIREFEILNKQVKIVSIEEYPSKVRIPQKEECTYGERLFHKGVALMDFKELKVEEKRSKRKEEERKNETYKPKITTFSMNIYNKSFDTSLVSESVNAVKNYMKENEATRYRNQQQQASSRGREFEVESKDAFLDPNKSSSIRKRLTAEESLNLSIRLFEEARFLNDKKQKERMDFMEKVCPFSPNIKNKSPPKVENFYLRLQDWMEHKHEKSMRLLNESSIDYKTGQRLFSPRLLSNNPKRGDSDIMPINEPDKKFLDLYAGSKMYERKKKDKVESFLKDVKTQANNKKISKKSEKIAVEIKNSVFRRVFEILDTSEEGKIYGQQIDLNLLPETLRKILEPLIHELKEQNESLTSEEFLMACEHLYNVMPAVQKNIIFDYYFESRRNSNKKPIHSELTFKPQINIGKKDKSKGNVSSNLHISNSLEFSNTKDGKHNDGHTITYNANTVDNTDAISQS